jgi:hypothetical protein
MNRQRLATLGLGVLGVFVMAGVALGGAAAMAVPGPTGPIGNSSPSAAVACSVAVTLWESGPVAQVNQYVTFAIGIVDHGVNHATCPTAQSMHYTNLPAGPLSAPGVTCASASVPVLHCGVGALGLFHVTGSVLLSNGVTESASVLLYVPGPSA